MKKFLLISLHVTILSSCVWDEGVLGDDYYWMPDYEAEDVGYPGSIIYKSTNQNILRDIKIWPSIASAKANNKFIIAIQKPNKSIIEQMRSEGLIERKKPYDYLFKNDVNYYIINKKTDVIYGPLNKEEYVEKRKELLIPENLN